ncbi:MAG: fimbrillin family protein [Dysgonamonadaceae bacterium]|jgi:hypothetical protein|nr:fimbrillin family protein [Dysgonamonadaceae bacterium]
MAVAGAGFTSCEHKELFVCPPTGNIPARVIIHWDSVPANQLLLPNNMTVHWYPQQGTLLASDMSVYGGHDWLYPEVYDAMCLDFNGNSSLAFRSNGTREDFEAYNIRMTGIYNSYVPQLPGGEITVAEAYPYQWYIDSRSQTIDTHNWSEKDTIIVHFYPKNVLREFTFLVYDVIGAKYMTQNGGAISGMSGSYYPATGELADLPSTILFQRVEAIRDAQTSSLWTDQDKALFTFKDPNWANPDTLIGWTRDWVRGKFVTFGPLDRNENRFRLTVEAISTAKNYYHGSWGYWYGEWENTVASQIDSAMGKHGTWEEQLAWRERNGGYDILLPNDRRLVIPDGEGGNRTTDGFIVNVDDWGEIIDVPTTGNGSGAPGSVSPSRSAIMRAPVNTYATIPDFVVNGIYKEAAPSTSWSRIFNEQYVYKPESGLIWEYHPIKYWPTSGEIDFYAYAPAGIRHFVTGLHDNGDNLTDPVLEYTMPYKEREEPPPGTGEPPSPLMVDDKQEDLLVAVQNRTSPQTSPVPMNFRHAFSRVTVKARIDPNDSHYRIKVRRVDLRNLYTSGKLKLNKDNTDPLPAISTGIPMEQNVSFKYSIDHRVPGATLWYDTTSLACYPFKLASPAISIEDEYTTLLRNDDGIFVIPQEILTDNHSAIYVEYDIYSVSQANGEEYDTSVQKLLPLQPGFVFEIGRQYELHLNLDVP